jgi:2-amino-4-hydroxy-6-hydroxymethyldihydropteridine diphosphokinase
MQDRTLDLDIVLYGDVVSSKPSLPREDIYKYAFVIPNDGRTVTKIRQTMNNFDSLIAVNPFDSDVSK